MKTRRGDSAPKPLLPGREMWVLTAAAVQNAVPSRVNLQSLYGEGPISLHFLHEREHTRGSWNLCALLCSDSRGSQVLILSKSGGLAATFTGGSFTEVRERESKKWEREVSSEWRAGMGFGVSWGLPSSPCQNSGAQPLPHLKPGSTDKSLSPTPGSPKTVTTEPGSWGLDK